MTKKGAKDLPPDPEPPAPKPFPESYAKYLSALVDATGLGWEKFGEGADLSYETIYRTVGLKPGASVSGAKKVRRALLEFGFEVEPVPVDVDEWIPPHERKPVGPRLDGPQEIFRRNLVRFREEAGYGDLHEGARVTGIPFETLRAYELGEREVSGSHLLELAKVYGRDALHFEMESPPSTKNAPRRAEFRIIAPLEELSPENRARVESLQRETAELNRALNVELNAKKPKRL